MVEGFMCSDMVIRPELRRMLTSTKVMLVEESFHVKFTGYLMFRFWRNSDRESDPWV